MRRIKEFITIILSIVLAFLAIWQFKHKETIIIKIGMSHIFKPEMVSLLGYLIPLSCLIAFLLLALLKKSISYVISSVIFTFYFIYNIYLLITTDNDCGCSNIFANINLKYQIIGFSLLTMCSLLALFLHVRVKNLTSTYQATFPNHELKLKE